MNDYTYMVNYDADGNLLSVSRSDGAWIPADLGNSDYQAYLASQEEEN